MITCVLNADSDRYADTSIVNESVREIIIISTINIFLLLRSAFWQFRTITVSESCLIKLLKQSGESMQSVVKNKRKAVVGRICRKVLSGRKG